MSNGPHGLPPFQVTYDEGVKVGYKWYDAENKPVSSPSASASPTPPSLLRPERLPRRPGDKVKVTFTVANTGAREGSEIAEVYAALPASPRNLPSGWSASAKLSSRPEKSTTVTVEIDPKYLSIFDEDKDAWTLVPGDYTIMVGGSSQDLPLKATVSLK